jgi:hypothetical protein
MVGPVDATVVLAAAPVAARSPSKVEQEPAGAEKVAGDGAQAAVGDRGSSELAASLQVASPATDANGDAPACGPLQLALPEGPAVAAAAATATAVAVAAGGWRMAAAADVAAAHCTGCDDWRLNRWVDASMGATPLQGMQGMLSM